MSDNHKYTKVGEWNDRLETLGYDILSLISDGKTESVNEIIQHLEKSDVVHYLLNKYSDEMYFVTADCPYNLNEWEKVLGEYSYMSFEHDVRRKLGLGNEKTDGLLLLVNIILSEVSKRKYK